MLKFKTLASALVLGAFVATPVFAESHGDPAIGAAVKARKAHMSLYAYNLGILGAMAKQAMPYDAAIAGGAAGNLASLAKMNQMTLWPQGSEAGMAEGSRALPDLWANFPDVMEKSKALVAATDAMVTAAGTDLAALQAQMGPLGGACGACHKAYRQPE